MKKILSAILLAALLLPVVGCDFSSGAETTPSPAPTAEPIPTEPCALIGDIYASATPVPTAMKPVKADEAGGKMPVMNVKTNLLSADASTFENGKVSSWKAPFGGKLSVVSGKNGKMMSFVGTGVSYVSPVLDVYSLVKKAGAGDFEFSCDLVLIGEDGEPDPSLKFRPLIRGGNAKDENSFIYQGTSGNYLFLPNAETEEQEDGVLKLHVYLSVLNSDLDGKSHTWQICFDSLDAKIKEIRLDNAVFGKLESEEASETVQTLVTEAETWLANEITLISSKKINDPFRDVTLDLILNNGKSTLTVPGFWDGGNIWRVRFALPEAGAWSYETVCSDPDNAGLHGIKGTVECKPYAGDLAIYQHGFVKTEPGKKYFVYDDGTPFFYLGDTHWNFLAEEYDEAGSHAGTIDTTSHFKYIVNKRVAQGYTVYQSEPLEAGFNMTDGISESDIPGLRDADRYFAYIASQGLVHANAQFFFPSDMLRLMTRKTVDLNDLLDKLSRYWVARWGCYPVMWTLGQEIDNDYYFNENTKSNKTLTTENNPYKDVCRYLYRYDAYHHPISGHQEGSFSAQNYTTASNSAFKGVEGHDFFASQWKPVLNQPLDFSAAMDFWADTEGKPAIVYEGRYDSLWTNEYGARVQGWLAFLNGFYGHGYGAVDIWLYKSSYDVDNDTVRDGITTTKADKARFWSEAIEFPAGYQMGYMREFLEQYEWWNLIPRFGNTAYYKNNQAYYSLATIENDLYVLYLYDHSTKTGTLCGLEEGARYTGQWYNPRTHVMSAAAVAETDGSAYVIGERPTNEDWVFVLKKVK